MDPDMKNTNILSILVLVLLSVTAHSAFAAGGLSVLPIRTIFEDNLRSTSLQLLNKSDEEKTYRINFINLQMNNDGTVKELEEGEAKMPADRMLRFSPRQVTIPPNGKQTIRLVLRKKRGLEAGEYRSHLYFLELPKEDFGKSLESEFSKKDGGDFRIGLGTQFGISVPIIVRHGKLDAEVSIDKGAVSLNDKGEGVLTFDAHRTGNRSVFGDIEISHTNDNGDEPRHISGLLGNSIYTELDTRTFTAVIPPDVMETIKGGSFNIVYRDREHAKQGKVLATGSVSAPQ